MKKFLIISFFILISKIAFSEIYELESDEITFSVALTNNLIQLNKTELDNLFKVNKIKEFNIKNIVEGRGYNNFWIEKNYLNKTDKKISPTRLSISSNKKNLRSKEQFLEYRNKFEGENHKRVFINGYTCYIQISEIDLKKEDLFYKEPEKIYKNTVVVFMPDNRVANITLRSEEKLTTNDFINSINIFPRLKPIEFIKMNNIENFQQFYESQISEYMDDYLYEFSLLSGILNEIIGLQIQLDNSIFNYIDAFQSEQLDIEEFNIQTKKLLDDFDIAIKEIKDNYQLIQDNDFNDFVDGRYEYYINQVREYLVTLFTLLEQDKIVAQNIIKEINSSPQKDYENEINKSYFRSKIKDLEKGQFLFKSKSNTVFTSNESIINLANLKINLNEIQINIYKFMIDTYDLDVTEMNNSFIPIMKKNKILVEKIYKELEQADLNRKYFYIYMYSILDKLNNDNLKTYYNQIDQTMIDEIIIISDINKKLEKFINLITSIDNYEIYSEFFENYLKLSSELEVYQKNYEDIQTKRIISSMEYSEEMQKVMNN